MMQGNSKSAPNSRANSTRRDVARVAGDDAADADGEFIMPSRYFTEARFGQCVEKF